MTMRSQEKAASVELLAYKFIGYPDGETEHTLVSFCGAARFLWNRFLADSRDFYAIMGKALDPTPADYKDAEGLGWLNDVDSLALSNVQLNFEAAMQAFFSGRSGYPKFKKKGRCREAYKTNCSNQKKPNLRLDGNMLKLPKVKTPVRLNVHREVRPGGLLKNCTVSREDGKWYFSLCFEYPKTEHKLPDPDTVNHTGLDMSLPHLYVAADGSMPGFVKEYALAEEKLAREQRKLSRKKGPSGGEPSKNYLKQKARVEKLYAKTKHKRQDMLHKLSAALTDQYGLISIEDLDMSAMSRSLHFGKSVHDLGWGMFTDMLSYKQERKGHVLMKVSKWFPSSKTCLHCGHVHRELTLRDRTYICPACGHVMDRDHQAACNIDQEGLRLYRGACREACPDAA